MAGMRPPPGNTSERQWRTLLVITGVCLGGLSVGLVVPTLYEYNLLRDLAKRMVKDFATSSVAEVREAIHIECVRFNLVPLEGAIQVVPRSPGKGFQVVVDYPITYFERWKTFHLTFRTES
ncbi:MAG: hypothetical protein HQL56_10840 [Magnetococcales bacterium]|nr:hypothetical protein [Magnetococcales bacterium]